MCVRMRAIAASTVLLASLALGCTAADTLSLQQTIDVAIRNNPDIQAGRLSAEAALHAARGARALANPELIVAPSVVGEAGSDAAVFFNQPLEINGSRKARGRIAAHEAEAAAHNSGRIEQTIIRDVKLAYWDVVRAQQLVTLGEENLADVESLDGVVRRQVNVGAAPGSEVIKSEVELARARQELARARLDLAQARSLLNALLGRVGSAGVVAGDVLRFSPLAVDAARAVEIAVGRRPEVAVAASERAAAAGEVAAASAARRPDLAVQARRESFERDSAGGVAIAVTLPLPDWGSAKAEKRRAESEARSGDRLHESARNQVALEVEQAIQAVSTSQAIVEDYRGGIVSKSEELARLAQKGYERGALSYLEVLEAQRTLRAARADHISALADHVKSIAQIEWAAGVPLSELCQVEVEE